jgi:hypothetical protein
LKVNGIEVGTYEVGRINIFNNWDSDMFTRIDLYNGLGVGGSMGRRIFNDFNFGGCYVSAKKGDEY